MIKVFLILSFMITPSILFAQEITHKFDSCEENDKFFTTNLDSQNLCNATLSKMAWNKLYILETPIDLYFDNHSIWSLHNEFLGETENYLKLKLLDLGIAVGSFSSENSGGSIIRITTEYLAIENQIVFDIDFRVSQIKSWTFYEEEGLSEDIHLGEILVYHNQLFGFVEKENYSRFKTYYDFLIEEFSNDFSKVKK